MNIIEPFDDQLYLALSVIQENRKDIPAEEVEKVISVLNKNPFLPPSEMSMDMRKNWRPFNLDELAKNLGDKLESIVWLRANGSPGWSGSFSKNPVQNTLNLNLLPVFFQNDWLPKFREYIRELTFGFNEFTITVASADQDTISDFYLENDLNPLPLQIGMYLSWYSLVPEKQYSKYYSKEVLLNAPFYHVEAFEDGTIEMIIHPDPFKAYEESYAKTVIEVSKYLDKNRM
ncbi:hypothetical protein [Aquimarina sp. 2304DJ70-9]|uniref:hypothetical protein n=1 Tax=Aquimarina penaris TaxID=3231044 RepID=UPI0034632B35